jgi:23S rRNA pseudouridine2605 synthase
MRLQRALARAGVASRRRAEDLIRSGRVRVNGQVAELGLTVDPQRDTITVGTKRVQIPDAVWIALNKPVGYVVSRKDEKRRPTVFELVPDIPGLTYVGRLDVMTAGLLLLTTDGAACNRLTHPRYAVERSYRAIVHGRRAEDIRRALSRPIVIDRRPVKIIRHRVRARGSKSDITLVLTEGRYRIVRRLCEQLKVKVEQLVRLSHGPVRLARLAPGRWRYLTAGEKGSLSRLFVGSSP